MLESCVKSVGVIFVAYRRAYYYQYYYTFRLSFDMIQYLFINFQLTLHHCNNISNIYNRSL